MESVGNFFGRFATKGLNDESARRPGIRTDFGQSLEEGNFAKLPDQVLRADLSGPYARSLGLDEEDAIHRFVQSAGAFTKSRVRTLAATTGRVGSAAAKPTGRRWGGYRCRGLRRWCSFC